VASQLDKKAILNIVKDTIKHRQGTGFVLVMEHKVQGHTDAPGVNPNIIDYSIWPRFNQPCQGGELRKYEVTHPGECTQPHNRKPSDLWTPFPDGKPSAIAFNPFCTSAAGDELVKAATSEKSPWLKGFGGPQNIELLKANDGHINGILIKRLNVDPTVMVNLIQFLKQGYGPQYAMLVKAGLTEVQAMAAVMLNRGSVTHASGTYDYYFPKIFSARRFFEGKPRDLSGGLYEDRTDYNRTFVQDVFSPGPKRKGGIVFRNALLDKGIPDPHNYLVQTSAPIDVFVKACQEIFFEAMCNEPIIEDEPYEYLTENGRPGPLPVMGTPYAEVKKATVASTVKPAKAA